jgi:hypothetical protein
MYVGVVSKLPDLMPTLAHRKHDNKLFNIPIKAAIAPITTAAMRKPSPFSRRLR